MSSTPRSSTDYGYVSSCKHCGAEPISEGPHHQPTCVRHQVTRALESDLARRFECRFCGVAPFVAGSHHASECRRFFEVAGIDDSPSPTDDAPSTADGEAVAEHGELTLGRLLDVFESSEAPALTADEVARAVDCSRAAARAGLNLLVEREDLRRKSVGPDSTVFVLPREHPGG